MTDQGKPSLTNLRDFSSGSNGLVVQWVFLYINEIPQTPPQADQPQPHSLSSSMGCSRPLIPFEILCWNLQDTHASFSGEPRVAQSALG